MKFKNFIFTALMTAGLALCTLTSSAQNTVYLPGGGDLLSRTGPVLVPASGTTNLIGQATVKVHKGTAIAVYPIFKLPSGISSSNVTFQLAVSPGLGTNAQAQYGGGTLLYGTTNFNTTSLTNLQVVVPANATNANGLVMGFGTIPASSFDGSLQIELYGISTTATNAGGVQVSNVFWSMIYPQ